MTQGKNPKGGKKMNKVQPYDDKHHLDEKKENATEQTQNQNELQDPKSPALE